MIADPKVIPGLIFLTVELLALATVGYVVARVALRQSERPEWRSRRGLVIGLGACGA